MEFLPFKFNKLSKVFSFCCVMSLSLFTQQINALPIGFELYESTPGSGEQVSISPRLELKGRLGSSQILELLQQPNLKPKQMVQGAESILKQIPESGLALEVLGTGLFYQENFKSAAEAFERAAKLEPKVVSIKVKQGIALMEAGLVDQAIPVFNNALDIEASNRLALQRLGMIYEFKQDYSKAVKFYYKSLETIPGRYTDVALSLANLLIQSGYHQNAIDVLEPRLARISPNINAHLMLASAYLLTAKEQQALSRYEIVLDRNPDSREANLGKAIALRRLGKPEESGALVASILQKAPDWAEGRKELAISLLQQQKLEEAKAEMQRALNLGIPKARLYNELGDYYLRTKDFDSAERTFTELKQSGEGTGKTYIRLSELKKAQNDFPAAFDILKEGIEKHPKYSVLYMRLGADLAATKYYSDAEGYLEQAVQLNPTDNRSLQMLSLVYGRLNKYEQAAEKAKELYQLAPERIDFTLFYAEQVKASGNVKLSIQLAEGLLNSNPEVGLLRYKLGVFYLEDNQLQPALEQLQKAVDLQPNANWSEAAREQISKLEKLV